MHEKRDIKKEKTNKMIKTKVPDHPGCVASRFADRDPVDGWHWPRQQLCAVC